MQLREDRRLLMGVPARRASHPDIIGVNVWLTVAIGRHDVPVQ
jgi:hypothetical protein